MVGVDLVAEDFSEDGVVVVGEVEVETTLLRQKHHTCRQMADHLLEDGVLDGVVDAVVGVVEVASLLASTRIHKTVWKMTISMMKVEVIFLDVVAVLAVEGVVVIEELVDFLGVHPGGEVTVEGEGHGGEEVTKCNFQIVISWISNWMATCTMPTSSIWTLTVDVFSVK